MQQRQERLDVSQVRSEIDAKADEGFPQRTRGEVLTPGLTDGEFDVDDESCAMYRSVHCVRDPTPDAATSTHLPFS